MAQRDDNGNSIEQPMQHGNSRLKTDQVAMLARQLHGMLINGQRPTISNNSMRFEIGGDAVPFTVSFDSELEVFSVNYNFTVIKHLVQGNTTFNETPFFYREETVESSDGSNIYPILKFTKPVSGSFVIDFLWDPITRVNPGNVESIWWNSVLDAAVGNDAVTIDREVLFSGVEQFRTSLWRVTLFPDGTHNTLVPLSQGKINDTSIYIIDYDLRPVYEATYNFDDAELFVSAIALNGSFIDITTPKTSGNDFFASWGDETAPTGASMVIATTFGFVETKICDFAYDANGKLRFFRINHMGAQVMPQGLSTITINDGDQLKCAQGIVVGKA